MSDISLSEQSNDHYFERRDYITTSLKAAGASALPGMPVLSMANFQSNLICTN
jgi:hypothetical protein